MKLSLYNPSFLRWKNKFVICSRFLATPYSYEYTRDKLGCAWYNFNVRNISHFSLLKKYRASEYLYGEDPRIILFNGDSIFLVFNYMNETVWPSRRMCFVSVTAALSDVTSIYYSNNPTTCLTVNGSLGRLEQKNWSPFLYNESAYLIYSINPHRIIRVPELACNKTSPPSPQLPSDVVVSITYSSSMSDMVSVHIDKWVAQFGDIRGGTSAAMLPDTGAYLTFFHSKRRLKGRARATYFVGAYTFLPTPPFSVLQISPAPIIGKGFYSGRFAPQPFDYIIYPTSFVMSEDQATLKLYFGRQDEETWYSILNVTHLRHSLVP